MPSKLQSTASTSMDKWLDRLPAFIADPVRPWLKAPIRKQLNQFLSLGSESPIVVVLSGSMEPAFYRGDILFLHMGTAPLRTGEIVVYNLRDKDIPIVHRVIQVHEKADGMPGAGTTEVLTKGDNNAGNDRMLYNRGQKWLTGDHIMGRAKGFLPYVGMVTIVMNDYPALKYTVIGILGIMCLLGLDE